MIATIGNLILSVNLFQHKLWPLLVWPSGYQPQGRIYSITGSAITWNLKGNHLNFMGTCYRIRVHYRAFFPIVSHRQAKTPRVQAIYISFHSIYHHEDGKDSHYQKFKALNTVKLLTRTDFASVLAFAVVKTEEFVVIACLDLVVRSGNVCH